MTDCAKKGRRLAIWPLPKLKEIAGVASARQKLLDFKNRQLKERATRESQLAALESNVTQLEAKNEELRGQLAMTSTSSGSLQDVPASVRSMRAGFARQIVAEAEGQKKPKGPVYLNTPQGRVIVVSPQSRAK
jgi:hypothetical protein